MTEELPEDFWRGVEQFNQGEFYACHDTLEAVWIEAPNFEKNFYQGILQIAVSLYHLGNQNWRGAVILLGEGLNRLRKYPPNHGGVEVAELMAQGAEILSALQSAGADRVSEVVLLRSGSAIDCHEKKIVLLQPTIQKVSAFVE